MKKPTLIPFSHAARREIFDLVLRGATYNPEQTLVLLALITMAKWVNRKGDPVVEADEASINDRAQLISDLIQERATAGREPADSLLDVVMARVSQ